MSARGATLREYRAGSIALRRPLSSRPDAYEVRSPMLLLLVRAARAEDPLLFPPLAGALEARRRKARARAWWPWRKADACLR